MKKVVALLLVMVMAVGLLAGCGNKEKGSSQNDQKQENQNQGGKEDNSSNEADTPSGEVATRDYFPVPEKEELSIWYWFSNSYITDPNELYAFQWLEEQTNVHINFQVVNAAEANEKFGLMLAAGSYPDIIRACNGYYPGGLEKSVTDGVAIELTDLIPEHMPNYERIRHSSELLEKNTKTDDGKLVGIWSIASNNLEPQGEMMWTGLVVRRDWLDELNMEAPITIADWDTVLYAFKENYNCEAPLMLAKDGVNTTGAFLTAYGVYPEWYQVDGKILYGPMQDGYKEYLELMARWYADGIIDPNFVTNDGDIASPNEYMGTGRAGAGGTIWNYAADAYKTQGFTDDEDFYLEAVPSPVLNEGEHAGNAFVSASSVTKEAHVITSSCKNVELALRWMDMWYEDDVTLVCSYGKEGESYVVNADGTYSFTEEVMKTPDYSPMDALKVKWTPTNSDMGLFNWAYYEPLYSDSESFQAEYVWNQDDMKDSISTSVSMTEAENNEYSTLYTDIKTLVDEMTVKFIMGSEPLDNFDSFRDGLKTYGVERCAELWQAAYDRYLAR